MAKCIGCEAEYPAHPKWSRCLVCRREYQRAWRERRREAGLPASGSATWAPEKRAAWNATYHVRPDVRARKAAQGRQRWNNPNHRERIQARLTVRNAARRGDLVKPNECSQCGANGRIEAHHRDYSQPLTVEWLCRPCHESADATAEGRPA